MNLNSASGLFLTGLVAGCLGGFLLIMLLGTLVAPLTSELDLADVYSLTGLGWIGIVSLAIGLVTGTALAAPKSSKSLAPGDIRSLEELEASTGLRELMDATAKILVLEDKPGGPHWKIVVHGDGQRVESIWLSEAALPVDRYFLGMLLVHECRKARLSRALANTACIPLLRGDYEIEERAITQGPGIRVLIR